MKKVITILALIPTLCFGQWNQLGADIDGQAANEQSGTAISLNAAGTILINSAPRAIDAGIMKGKARVFEWNGTSWLQKGSDLVGTSQGDVFGHAVSLNSNGNIIAVGAPDLIILHRLLDTQEFMNGMVQIIFKRELILLEKPMAIPQAQQLV